MGVTIKQTSSYNRILQCHNVGVGRNGIQFHLHYSRFDMSTAHTERATPSDLETRNSWTYLMCLQSILVWVKPVKPVKPWSRAVRTKKNS